MELNKKQKEFILTFFKHNNFSGWKEIAEKLLDNGYCIVAGEKCIWNSGIGNFINTEDVSDGFGCLKYVFNLDIFLDSSWFKEHRITKLNELKEDLENIENEISSISYLLVEK